MLVRKDFLMSLAEQEIVQVLDFSDSSQLASMMLGDEDIWGNFQHLHMVNLHNCRVTSIEHIKVKDNEF